MATKPTVNQKATGSKATAADWNNGVYQQWQFLDITKPVCTAYQTGAQLISTGTTWVPLSFDSEVIDTDGQHAPSPFPTRITIGNTLGWYLVWGGVAYTADFHARRGARVMLNGGASPVIGSQMIITPYGVASGGTTATAFQLDVASSPALVQSVLSTDYIELQTFQDSGGGLNTSVAVNSVPFLTAIYMGTLQ